MADYAVIDWVSSITDLASAMAEVETKLETLDSTTNPIIMSGVKRHGDHYYQAYIIYTG